MCYFEFWANNFIHVFHCHISSVLCTWDLQWNRPISKLCNLLFVPDLFKFIMCKQCCIFPYLLSTLCDFQLLTLVVILFSTVSVRMSACLPAYISLSISFCLSHFLSIYLTIFLTPNKVSYTEAHKTHDFIQTGGDGKLDPLCQQACEAVKKNMHIV